MIDSQASILSWAVPASSAPCAAERDEQRQKRRRDACERLGLPGPRQVGTPTLAQKAKAKANVYAKAGRPTFAQKWQAKVYAAIEEDRDWVPLIPLQMPTGWRPGMPLAVDDVAELEQEAATVQVMRTASEATPQAEVTAADQQAATNPEPEPPAAKKRRTCVRWVGR